jgi:pimeloyl-ACP methyl ester carboxylesterase
MDFVSFVKILGRKIEYGSLPAAAPSRPALVFLHEGLGSAGMWKEFPARCAERTGCGALVYSRSGYGFSEAERQPWPVTFLHEEALEVLPRLLDELGIGRHIPIGHSDGGSIALIYAGSSEASRRRLEGVVAMAPHVIVEDLQTDGIRELQAAFETSPMRAKLARYHADVDSTFRGWSGAWLDPAFRAWNIEEYLGRIACPVLAIQGNQDEYGTMEHLDRIGRLAPGARLLKLDRCGHAPHRDQPGATLEAIVAFVELVGSRSTA